jgi:hypothetical protein
MYFRKTRYVAMISRAHLYFLNVLSLQANHAAAAAEITSMLHRFVEITPNPVKAANQITQDQLLEAIKTSPDGREALVLLYNFKTQQHHGKAAAKSRIQMPGFCKRILFDWLQSYMGARYDGKGYENIQLRRDISSGHKICSLCIAVSTTSRPIVIYSLCLPMHNQQPTDLKLFLFQELNSMILMNAKKQRFGPGAKAVNSTPESFNLTQ